MRAEKDTFIVQLTVGELLEILKDNFPMLATNSPSTDANKQSDGPTFNGRLVYGLRGIRELFNVSHKTAQHWKNTWLAPAIKQNGRIIVTDADYAMKLFGGLDK